MTSGNLSKKQMPQRRSLFWDVDPGEIDPEKHARYIIERILEFGRDDEVKWMRGNYPEELIGEVVSKSRVLRPRTKALWELLTKAN